MKKAVAARVSYGLALPGNLATYVVNTHASAPLPQNGRPLYEPVVTIILLILPPFRAGVMH